MVLEHVVAENVAEVVDEMLQAPGLEQFQRSPVDLNDADAVGAVLDAVRPVQEMTAEIRHSVATPSVKEGLHAAEILQPQRHRSQMKHLCIVAKLAAKPF